MTDPDRTLAAAEHVRAVVEASEQTSRPQLREVLAQMEQEVAQDASRLNVTAAAYTTSAKRHRGKRAKAPRSKRG